MLKDSNPELIVLDLYVSDPSGAEDWKTLRDHGYQGGIIILAGPSMMSVLKGMRPGARSVLSRFRRRSMGIFISRNCSPQSIRARTKGYRTNVANIMHWWLNVPMNCMKVVEGMMAGTFRTGFKRSKTYR